MIALRVLRDGAVVREAIVHELPLTLGRSAASGFPLADASVSREHARLERDESGLLVLRDLGSRNGLHVGPRRVESVAIPSRLRCLVGSVEIEIEPAQDDVTQEIRLHDWRRFERRRGARSYLAYLALGVAGWLCGVAGEAAFWSPWEKGRGVILLEHALGVLLTLPFLALLLLGLLRAFGRRLRLADTLLAMSALLWLLPLGRALAFLAYYVLSSGALTAFRAWLGVAALAWSAAVLASIRRPRPLRLRAAWALSVVGVAAVFALISQMTAERAGQPDLDFGVQMPLAGRAGRSVTLDDYAKAVAAAAAQASEQAAAQRAKQEDK